MPMRWQHRLFSQLCAGEYPEAVDLPTGLGKTSVMAIWLIARACAAPDAAPPRRLIYVVDRRAVVDQATSEAEKIAKALEESSAPVIDQLRQQLGLQGGRRLPVSTLRGQFADNRLWLDDPAATAIVVGTVDMIGSRLLFSGYGVSPRRRPVHAALLGQDALIVLDEAHLVPPFQALIEQVCQRTAEDSKRAATLFEIQPMLTMALSATGRQVKGKTFELRDEDLERDDLVRKRVNAPKWIKLHGAPPGNLAETMANRALEVAGGRYRVIVFCNSRKIAQGVYDKLEKVLGKDQRGTSLELIVGARRVREREELAGSSVFRRFAHLPAKEGRTEPTGAAYLVATSAGEVGVDIDADHMICDLVAWERMVQRLGRVNRRGEFADGSLIDVFVNAPDMESETPAGTPPIETCRKPFDSAAWTRRDDGRLDASPGALRRLRDNVEFKKLTDQATTGEPLRPALTPTLLDAWTMTALGKHAGRPKVAPWIRGWIDEDKEPPQTQLLWRRHLPIRLDDDVKQATRKLERFFQSAPPHLSEILETEAFRAVDMLRSRAKALLRHRSSERKFSGEAQAEDRDETPADEGVSPASASVASSLESQTIVAIALAQDGSIEELLRLEDIPVRDAKRLQNMFAEHQVVLDARVGGLDPSGLLNAKAADIPATLDRERVKLAADLDGATLWSDNELEKIGFRVRIAKHHAGEEDWKVAFRRFTDEGSEEADDAETREEWRVEEWVGDREAQNEPALAKFSQTLKDHTARVEYWADRIARRLNLPENFCRMLMIAARHHDCGKARPIWQRYAGNPDFARGKAEPLAKFATWANPQLLKVGDGSYRHEFGSLHDAQANLAFDDLPPPLRMLGLRLIAAHHGQARPWIFAYDEKRSVEESTELAAQIVDDFVALQGQWGVWGLAWWEALLRAADVAASREKSEQETR